MPYHKLFFLLLFITSCAAKKNKPTTTKPIETAAVKIRPGKKMTEFYRYTPDKIVDIIHEDLSVSFDWQQHFCIGKSKIKLAPYFKSIKEIELDAKAMEIKNVDVFLRNTKLVSTYEYNEYQLKINLENTISPSDTIELIIDYIAKPDMKKAGGSNAISSDKGLYFINTDLKNKYKPMQLWTQGETEANSCWFPCIDKPHEKSTFTLHITVPDSMTSLSNGNLIYQEKMGNERIDHWEILQPMSAYLVMMAISNFSITYDSLGTLPINYYVDKNYEKDASLIFNHTPEMINYFSKILGVAYPWSKYSQVIAHDYVSGAMENTSASLFGSFVQKNSRELIDENNDGIVAHELFHQWFGDLVTCESWSHLVLNEGFATLSEQLWEEYKNGEDAGLEVAKKNMDNYLRNAENNDGPIVQFYYHDKEDMFSSITYQKGSRVLNLLRHTLGKETFYLGLKNYLNTYAYQTAQIDDLRREFEKVSGKDLRLFFKQWFLEGGHPVFEINSTIDSLNQLQISIAQLQADSLKKFETPINFRVTDGKTSIAFDVDIIDKNHNVSISLNEFEPSKVSIFADSKGVIVGEIIEKRTAQENILAFENAENYIEKIRALEGIIKYKDSSENCNAALFDIAKNTNPSLAFEALSNIDFSKNNNSLYGKDILLEIAKKNTTPELKSLAINNLNSYKDNTLFSQMMEWSNEPSYLVSGAGLYGVHTLIPEEGLRQAEKLEYDAKNGLLLEIAKIYSEQKNPSKLVFFKTNFEKLPNLKNNLSILFAKYIAINSTEIDFEKEFDYIQSYVSKENQFYTRVITILSLNNCIKTLKEQKNIDIEKEALIKKYIVESEEKYNSLKENADYKNEFNFITQYKLLDK